MTPPPRNDYSELAVILQSTINPLVAELQELKKKVDALTQNHLTRTEIVENFVDRAFYETRHSAILDHCKDIDQDLQKVHDRLESDKKQIEDRFKAQQDTQLSEKDRAWIRWSQVVGYVGIALVVLDFAAQHLKFN